MVDEGLDELLAMLEPGTVELGAGRATKPRLTRADINAALGMSASADHFSATVYHAARAHRYNPEEIDQLLARVQFEEWRNRAERLLAAQLAQAAADIATDARERRFLQARSSMMLAGARAAMWPPLVEPHYKAMRAALIDEIRGNHTCPVCMGRGAVIVDNLPTDCANCVAGRVPVTDRQRAIALGLHPSTYLRTWKRVHEWMYRLMCDAVKTGREEFSRALGRSAA